MSAVGVRSTPRPLHRTDPGPALLRLGCVVAAISLWQIAVSTGVVGSSAVAAPASVAKSLWPPLSSGHFWSAVEATVRSWGIGLLLSVAIAIPIGLILGTSDLLYRMSRFTIDFLRTIPPVALVPLALLLYGATETMALVLIIFGSVWPVLLHTMYGVHQLDPVTRAVARAYRLRRRDVFLRVTLPSAAPFIATGIRIAATMSLLLAIGAELIGGAPGVGNSIATAQQNGDTPQIYAFVLVSAALGVVLNLAILRLERKALWWHPPHRSSAAA
jgi:ABC-type nitrate/sulfonate/bicarbonate transport system permease component